jgi:type I restriction enzyme R subunit
MCFLRFHKHSGGQLNWGKNNEAAPIKDQASFVNQIAAIARENNVVLAQIDKNTKDQALKGNLPGAVQGAVVRAMTSNNALASLLLKSDKQGLGILTNMIYDILKSGNEINLDDLDAA